MKPGGEQEHYDRWSWNQTRTLKVPPKTKATATVQVVEQKLTYDYTYYADVSYQVEITGFTKNNIDDNFVVHENKSLDQKYILSTFTFSQKNVEQSSVPIVGPSSPAPNPLTAPTIQPESDTRVDPATEIPELTRTIGNNNLNAVLRQAKIEIRAPITGRYEVLSTFAENIRFSVFRE
jgi:hypothetical protein